MVVPKDNLFGDDYFQGFRLANEVDYENRIKASFSYMERILAEEDEKHKQPIGYAIILNPRTKKIFVYQKSKQDKQYPEKRLQGNFSIGVGGHIEQYDDKTDPIRSSLIREISEEIEFVPGKSKLLGYINDDSNAVGRVHIGMLYLIETSSEIVFPKDAEIAASQMKTLEEFEAMCNDPQIKVENWSIIALEPLKKYMSELP